ncbi:uncharacterized protein LOC62_02G002570 [Vanrija pseudolonga]|uniref:Uncharacterized protein n=1 Tax=Vanrija pseudolonga TaxID=143232 RepID=A0AAF1BP86_9TREE|nr:hypothetical protein LOC62_02G002570 [Vanrija pseudolonga]
MTPSTPIISLVSDDDSDDDIVCTGMTPRRRRQPLTPRRRTTRPAQPKHRVTVVDSDDDDDLVSSFRALAIPDVEYLGANHSPARSRPGPRGKKRASPLAAAPDNTAIIDFAYFPHLLDRIIECSPHAAIRLRAASSWMCGYIDAKIFAHVVISPRKPSAAYEAAGSLSSGSDSSLFYFTSGLALGINLPGFGTQQARWWKDRETFVREHGKRLHQDRFKSLTDKKSFDFQRHFGSRLEAPRDPLDLLAMRIALYRIDFRVNDRLLALLKRVKTLDIHGMGTYSAPKGTFLAWITRVLSPQTLRIFPDEHGLYYDSRVSFSARNIVVFPSGHAVEASKRFKTLPAAVQNLAKGAHQFRQLAASFSNIPVRTRGVLQPPERVIFHVKLGVLNKTQLFPLLLGGNKSVANDAPKFRLENTVGVYLFSEAAPNLHDDEVASAKKCIHRHVQGGTTVRPKWEQLASHLALAIFRGLKCVLVDYDLVDQIWLDFEPDTTAELGLKRITEAVTRSLQDGSHSQTVAANMATLVANLLALTPNAQVDPAPPTMTRDDATKAVGERLICISGKDYKQRLSPVEFEAARIPDTYAEFMRLARETDRHANNAVFEWVLRSNEGCVVA